MRDKAAQFGVKVVSFGPVSASIPNVFSYLVVRNSEHGPYISPSMATVKKVSDSIKSTGPHDNLFHFYDSGFSDIFFIHKMIRKFPKSIFILNFHWANEVVRIFRRKDLVSKIQVSILGNLFRRFPKNLVLTAESQGLADICSSRFSVEVLEYPVFSIYQPERRSMKENDFILVTKIESEARKILASIDKLNWGKSIPRVLILGINQESIIESLKKDFVEVNIEGYCFTLSQDMYREIHLNSRVLILPYASEFYKWGSSGRVCDAATLGNKVVLPDDLEIASKALELKIGFTYKRDDCDSIELAIKSAWLDSWEPDQAEFVPDFQSAIKWMIELFESRNGVVQSKFSTFDKMQIFELRALGILGWWGTLLRRKIKSVFERLRLHVTSNSQ
jgi:hypothetical protein